ncbi:MAG: DNA internalization-related competence protein ComEC/Rec2 [Thermodesulfovibrionia bacterium]|nr:DNA internalization-related competence protein ComEC/Rec2 [Thermodesulfovibrionia bacterium]
MIPFAVSFIGGLTAFHYLLFFPVSISALCISITAFLFIRQRINKKKICIILLIFLSGFIYNFLRHTDIPENTVRLNSPSHFSARVVSLEGTVRDVPEVAGGKARFTLDNVYIEGKQIQGKVRLFLLENFLNNDMQWYVPVYGDRIRALTRLREPHLVRNPGVYSYDFKKDGIVALGYIKQMQFVGSERGVFPWIHNKRQVLGTIIDNSLSIENASLHKAIIPGLKRGITQDMRDAFSATGLAHLLSISGTHFGLLAFIIFKLIKMAVKSLPIRLLTKMTLYITPTQIAVIFTLPVLVMYALISGASTPTIRSLIMVFIYMLALFLGRKDQWLNSLSIAALIILLWQPEALFELSFQLSFIAVLSIGYVLERQSEHRTQDPVPDGTEQSTHYKKPLKTVYEKIKTGFLITSAAVLGTAPFVALYFKQFPFISPLTNLIVTPLVCFIILPLGFFTCFSALLLNLSILPFNRLTETVTYLTLKLIKIFSQIPYANFHIHNPSFLIIVLYFIALIFVVKSRLKWRFLPLTLVVCFYVVSPYLSLNKNMELTFLDVGQGESSVVKLPDNKVMLIDGGAIEPDMGRSVIAPFLWAQGIRDIDYLVVSHPHPDHYGGLIYIVNNFHVKEIWLNGRRTDDAEHFFQTIKEKKIQQRVLKRGDLIQAAGYEVYVFHPYDEFYAGSSRGQFSNENSDSLVFKIQTGDVSVLFTGDIEAEAEENIVHLGKWLKSDILKGPHHGGRTSSSGEFIKMVNPETAVISAGRDNPFNHPHEETVQRYHNAGIRLFRTDRDGAVSITSEKNSYSVKTYQSSVLKKVNGLKDEIRNLLLLIR